MSRADAERVQRLLEQAGDAAKPLKDADLSKKIGTATEHVKTKLDPKSGG